MRYKGLKSGKSRLPIYPHHRNFNDWNASLPLWFKGKYQWTLRSHVNQKIDSWERYEQGADLKPSQNDTQEILEMR